MRGNECSKSELENILDKLNILQDYVQLKFGLDFTSYLNSRKEGEDDKDSSDLCITCKSRHRCGREEEVRGQVTEPLDSSRSNGSSRRSSRIQNQIQNNMLSDEPGLVSFNEGNDEDDSNSDVIIKEEAFIPSHDEDEDSSDMMFMDPEFLPIDEDSDSEYEGPSAVLRRSRTEAGGASDDQEEEEDLEDSQRKKQQRRNLEWDEKQRFSSTEEARAYIKTFREFTLRCNKETQEEVVSYFHCKRQPSCPARMKIRVPKGKTLVAIVERTSAPHAPHAAKAPRGLPVEVQAEIKDLLPMKPRKILRVLEEKGLFVPSKVQLNNFLRPLREKKWSRKKKGKKPGDGTEESGREGLSLI